MQTSVLHLTVRSSKTFKELYEVDSGKSFRCDSEEKVESFEGGNLTSFTTWDLQVQAFRGDNKTKFDDGECLSPSNKRPIHNSNNSQ